jgi:hypothetical protein
MRGGMTLYPINTKPIIFEQYRKTTGGRRRKKRKTKRKFRGGWGLLDSRYNYVQPVASALGQASFGASSAYNTLMGRSLGTNPNPTTGHFQ